MHRYLHSAFFISKSDTNTEVPRDESNDTTHMNPEDEVFNLSESVTNTLYKKIDTDIYNDSISTKRVSSKTTYASKINPIHTSWISSAKIVQILIYILWTHSKAAHSTNPHHFPSWKPRKPESSYSSYTRCNSTHRPRSYTCPPQWEERGQSNDREVLRSRHPGEGTYWDTSHMVRSNGPNTEERW